jgi:hypothetical protein
VKTLDSYLKEEARLRALHTEQTSASKWKEAETTRGKLIATLNAMAKLR